VESFNAWKSKFDKELSLRKTRGEEGKLKALTPKEREECKKLGVRLTGGHVFHFSVVVANHSLPGRQLFEHDRNLATSDASLLEEGTVSVDVSQYERITTKKEDEEERLEFSDSD
jgi:hypothetical protein